MANSIWQNIKIKFNQMNFNFKNKRQIYDLFLGFET